MTANSEKFTTINKYLEEEYMLLHLDARRDGVELPSHLMGNPTVTLKLSLGFRGGMEITEERVWASLTFGGKFRDCFVPLTAIWGATSATGANTIWSDDAPPEIILQILDELKTKTGQTPSPVAAVPNATKKKPTKTKTAKARPNHLKRIK